LKQKEHPHADALSIGLPASIAPPQFDLLSSPSHAADPPAGASDKHAAHVSPSAWDEFQTSARPAAAYLEAVREIASPVARALVKIQPMIDQLRRLEPTWEGWKTYDERLRALADGDDERGSDHEMVRTIFEVIYRGVWRRGEGEDPARYRNLGVRLYDTLAKLPGFRIEPPLDQLLCPLPIKRENAGDFDIQWVKGPGRVGTVARIIRIGMGAQRAKLAVLQGDIISPELDAWLALPPPPGPDLSDDSHPVWRWYREVQAAPFRPERFESALVAHRARFKQWIVSQAGLDWFHDAASGALTGATAAKQWIERLTSNNWCECWPRIVDGIEAPCWPTERSTGSGSRVTWAYSFSVPVGKTIAIHRFAPELAYAEAMFSLGPQRAGSPLSFADTIYGEARPFPELQDLAGRLHAATRDARVGCVGQFDAEALVLALIDRLTAIAARKTEACDVAGLDRLLAALRRWCELTGHLEILPLGWNFSVGAVDAAADVPEFSEVSHCFGATERGSIQVLCLGLREISEDRRIRRLIRKSRLVLSAGAAPNGWAQLFDRFRTNPLPGYAELVADLETWPTTMLRGPEELRTAAVELFKRFWRIAHMSTVEIRDVDALATLLASFGLKAFLVEDIKSLPSSECVVSSCGPLGSRVTKLVRPGLRHEPVDRLGTPRLILPAIVELD
jgi:hypothetical protein